MEDAATMRRTRTRSGRGRRKTGERETHRERQVIERMQMEECREGTTAMECCSVQFADIPRQRGSDLGRVSSLL